MKGRQAGAPLFYLHLPLAAFLSGFFPPAGVLPAKVRINLGFTAMKQEKKKAIPFPNHSESCSVTRVKLGSLPRTARDDEYGQNLPQCHRFTHSSGRQRLVFVSL